MICFNSFDRLMMYRYDTSLHHRAEDTALRPEGQEHANGVGTAGDDLAI